MPAPRLPRPPQEVAVFAHIADGAERAHRFVPAGLLAQTTGAQGAAQSFQYGLRYGRRPTAFELDPRALSLRAPGALDGAPLFPLPGLQEFGGIRDAAPDAWGRRVIEARYRVPANSLDELTYLLEAGSDRVGALDVRESLQAEPRRLAGGLDSLPYLLQAVAAIEAGEELPAHLEPYLGGAPSAGGARPKASVRDAAGVLWLAKFPAKNDAYDMAIAEAGALELARQAGLTVPPVQCYPLLGKMLLLIRRFDRYWAPPGELPDPKVPGHETQPGSGLTEGRLPQISALTLTGHHEADPAARSYRALAGAIRQHGHPQFAARDTAELFARMVFNIFVTNDDDHLRNHAFLYDATAGGWRLSPLYDVVPRPLLAQERMLHLDVGRLGRLATLDNAMSEYSAFLPDRSAALATIRRVWGVVRQWKLCFEALGAPPALLTTMAAAIRPLEGIASAELVREIRKGS